MSKKVYLQVALALVTKVKKLVVSVMKMQSRELEKNDTCLDWHFILGGGELCIRKFNRENNSPYISSLDLN